jgi:hypothetical protein
MTLFKVATNADNVSDGATVKTDAPAGAVDAGEEVAAKEIASGAENGSSEQ